MPAQAVPQTAKYIYLIFIKQEFSHLDHLINNHICEVPFNKLKSYIFFSLQYSLIIPYSITHVHTKTKCQTLSLGRHHAVEAVFYFK